MYRKIHIILFFFLFSTNYLFGISVSSDSVSNKKSYFHPLVITESVALVSEISFLQFYWYRNLDSAPFHFYNDYNAWQQLDKAKHITATYHLARISYYFFRKTNLNTNHSILYAGLTGLVFMTPLEVIDAIHEGYGFSWSDMTSNLIGSFIFVSQQKLFQYQRLRVKISYLPSPFPSYPPYMLGSTTFQKLMFDYNAYTYWLSGNLNSFLKKEWMPEWLNLAIGYGGDGMLASFNNPTTYDGKPIPEYEKYRQYYLSFDVDLSKIKTKRKGLKFLFSALQVIKIPAPTLEFNRVNKMRLHIIR